jgi:hypothetical protein
MDYSPSYKVEKLSVIMSMLNDYMGNIQLTDANLRGALNLAISEMSQSLRVPYFVPFEFQDGVSGYDVSTHYLGSSIAVEIARVDDNVFDRVAWWQLANGMLQVSPSLSGPGQIVSLAEPPRVPQGTLVIAEHLDYPGTEIWISGRVNELPLAGWVAIGNDVFFYRGLTFTNAPDNAFLPLEQALIDNGADPELFNQVYDMTLGTGTYTKLSNVTIWPVSYQFAAHNIGETIEPCISYMSGEMLNKLITAAAVNAYRVKINSCAQPEDKQLYSQLMRNAQEHFEKLSRFAQPPVSQVMKRRNAFSDFSRAANRVLRG